ARRLAPDRPRPRHPHVRRTRRAAPARRPRALRVMSLVVTRTLGLSTIQDRGRCGHMHEALPPGGALVPELLAAANRSAGNPDDAPAIEVLGILTVRATADVTVATDGTPAR